MLGKRADADFKRGVVEKQFWQNGNAKALFYHFQCCKIFIQLIADVWRNLVQLEDFAGFVVQTVCGQNEVLVVDVCQGDGQVTCKRMRKGCDEHQFITSKWYKRQSRNGEFGHENAVQLIAHQFFLQFAKAADRKLEKNVRIFFRKIFDNARKPVIGNALDRADADQAAVQSGKRSGGPCNLVFGLANGPKRLFDPGHVGFQFHTVFGTDEKFKPQLFFFRLSSD